MTLTPPMGSNFLPSYMIIPFCSFCWKFLNKFHQFSFKILKKLKHFSLKNPLIITFFFKFLKNSGLYWNSYDPDVHNSAVFNVLITIFYLHVFIKKDSMNVRANLTYRWESTATFSGWNIYYVWNFWISLFTKRIHILARWKSFIICYCLLPSCCLFLVKTKVFINYRG